MNTTTFLTSSCRYCRYYQSQGRRGGTCQQLGVPVQSKWKACALAAYPFTSTWENLEEVVRLEKSLTLTCSGKCALVDSSQKATCEIKEPAIV